MTPVQATSEDENKHQETSSETNRKLKKVVNGLDELDETKGVGREDRYELYEGLLDRILGLIEVRESEHEKQKIGDGILNSLAERVQKGTAVAAWEAYLTECAGDELEASMTRY